MLSSLLSGVEVFGVEKIRDDRIERTSVLDTPQTVDVMHPCVAFEHPKLESDPLVSDCPLDGQEFGKLPRNGLLRVARDEAKKVSRGRALAYFFHGPIVRVKP